MFGEERLLVFGVDVNPNAFEFFDDITDSQKRQVSQATFLNPLRKNFSAAFSQRSFMHSHSEFIVNFFANCRLKQAELGFLVDGKSYDCKESACQFFTLGRVC